MEVGVNHGQFRTIAEARRVLGDDVELIIPPSEMMAAKLCPLCDLEMEHQDSEPDVGIVGGWYCSHCDLSLPDDDYDEDDWL